MRIRPWGNLPAGLGANTRSRRSNMTAILTTPASQPVASNTAVSQLGVSAHTQQVSPEQNALDVDIGHGPSRDRSSPTNSSNAKQPLVHPLVREVITELSKEDGHTKSQNITAERCNDLPDDSVYNYNSSEVMKSAGDRLTDLDGSTLIDDHVLQHPTFGAANQTDLPSQPICLQLSKPESDAPSTDSQIDDFSVDELKAVIEQQWRSITFSSLIAGVVLKGAVLPNRGGESLYYVCLSSFPALMKGCHPSLLPYLLSMPLLLR